jgi:uncharacterized damage-inducible protein DinB
MEWQEFITDVYGRTLQALERALKGLTKEDLNQQPHPDCNSMGWLAWHLTRVQDSIIASLKGEEQLWIRDKWYAKFNRPSDPKDTGGGHSSEDVAAFKSPDVETLLGYHRSVLERSKGYISGLSITDLDKQLKDPHFKTPLTVGQLLIIIISDGLQHAGQVAYLRGLLKGKGWI